MKRGFNLLCIGVQFYRTADISSNGSVMPIGDYEFTIKLKNGNIAKKTFIMPTPCMKTSNGYKFT